MSSLTPTDAATSISRAVVPAAGLGTRLRPLTYAIPKELLPIGREPVLARVVAELRAAGITRILFVVSERKPQIRAYFGDRYDGGGMSGESREGEGGEETGLIEAEGNEALPPVQCDYVMQREQRGSGDAVLCAEEWVGGEPFVVAFGDCLIESAEPGGPLRRLIATHTQHRSPATALVEAVNPQRVSRYGVVAPAEPLPAEPSDPFAVVDLVEKPAVETAPSNLVVAARWALDPAVFAALHRGAADARGELNIPDSARMLLARETPGWAVPLRAGEARRDIGTMESFLTQFVRAALHDPEYGATLRGLARAELETYS